MRIDNAVETIRTCLDAGGKVLICGNGGSAAQADHFMAEMIGSGFACISLTNPAVITALGNDISYDYVFVEQIRALGKHGDVLILLSTSGQSMNIKMAKLVAKGKIMEVIELPTIEDIKKWYWFQFSNAQDVQELHIKWLHQIWKGLLDEKTK